MPRSLHFAAVLAGVWLTGLGSTCLGLTCLGLSACEGSGSDGGTGGAADARAPAGGTLADATPSPDAAPDAAPDALADARSGDDAGYERDPARLDLHGPCPPAIRFGGFKVEANEADGYTAIDGVVRDGVPPNVVPDDGGVDGDCRLLRARRLICEPTCEPGFTCDVGGLCVPMPVGQDMGPLVFRGLVEPVTLEAIQPGNTYFFTRLPHPGFVPGQVVHLTNTSGYLGPLALYGVGVPPIVSLADTWTLQAGEALTLGWQAPVEGGRARVLVEMNIDQHGLTPLTLVCDLPDTGQATLPVGATDALIAAGVTGFPSGRLTRRTADSFTDPGATRCVDFFVTSVRAMTVSVAGHVPCTRDADCPPPEVCDLLIQQCH